ncbi:MAG: diguanylate cyclase [Acidimicrobiales bacterium]
MTGPDRTMRAARRGAVLALLVGGLSAVLGATYAHRVAVDSAQERFDLSGQRATAGLEQELQAYIDSLHQVGAYAAVGPVKPPADVEAFVRETGVFERFSSLSGIVVLRRVAPEARADFLAAMRTVQPEFTIVGLGPLPPGAPSYVIEHHVPGALDLPLFPGLDVAAIDSVRTELEWRGARGEAVAGAIQDDPSVRRIAEQLDAPGLTPMLEGFDFFLAVPVDAGGDAGRGETTWVAAPIGGFDEVFARSLEGQPTDVGMDLTVNLTGPAVTDASVRQVARRSDPPGTMADAAFSRELTFQTSGIDWTLTVWSSPTAADPGPVPLLVLGFGLAASALAGAVVLLRGVGRARRAELARLEVDHERVRAQGDVLAAVTEAVALIGDDGVIRAANPAWDRLCGRSPAAPGTETPDVGRPYLEVLAEASDGDLSLLAAAIERVRSGGTARAEMDVALRTDGTRWWCSVRITPMEGPPHGLVLVHRDVTDRRNAERRAERRASHDPLTGLLNRTALEHQVTGAILHAQGREGYLGVLFVDIDDFKALNDTSGHAFGDAALRAAAARLTRWVRGGDLVARFGGDEFVVVLAPLESVTAAEALADRVLRALDTDVRVGTVTHPLSASIGLAVAPVAEVEQVTALIDAADEAMYRSKRGGGGRVTVVQPTLR